MRRPALGTPIAQQRQVVADHVALERAAFAAHADRLSGIVAPEHREADLASPRRGQVGLHRDLGDEPVTVGIAQPQETAPSNRDRAALKELSASSSLCRASD